jgi:hypothetical protein
MFQKKSSCVHELGSLFPILYLMVFPERKKMSGEKWANPQTHAVTIREKILLNASF